MMTRFFNKLIKTYQISIGLLAISIIIPTIYFWHLGYFDGGKQSKFYQFNFKSEALSQDNTLTEVRKKVTQERYKEALELLKIWKNEIEFIGSSVGSSSADSIVELENNLQKDIERLVGYSKIAGVLAVFHTKLEKFHVMTITNNWKSLATISERILSQSESNIDAGKLQRYIANVNRDFEIMSKVVEISLLQQDKKKIITDSILSMQTEIEMLAKYGDERKKVMGLITNLENQFLDWHKTIAPAISIQKGHMENIGNYYLQGILVLITILCFVLVINNLLSKKYLSNLNLAFETQMQDYVSGHIINSSVDGLEKYSLGFQDFTNKTTKNLSKQYNFSLILKEAIPFASILIGDDLSVQWVNQKFCDLLGMSKDDFTETKRNWIELETMLSFSNTHLIETCLNDKKSGTYSVQLKNHVMDKFFYYDLHVSNVVSQNKCKVMLYFVPQSAVNEMIESHVKNVTEPIASLIGVLIDGNPLAEDEELRMQADFDAVGIKNIYQLLIDLNLKNIEKQADSSKLLEDLNNKVDHLLQFYESAQRYQIGITSYGRSEQETLKFLKGHLISLTKNAKSFELISKNHAMLSEKILSGLHFSIREQKDVRSAFNEVVNSLPRFESLKENIDGLRNEVHLSKTRMANTLAQFAHFKKRLDSSDAIEKFQQVFDKTQHDYMLFDRLSSELDKKVIQLEQTNTKVIMAIELLGQKVGHQDIESRESQYVNLNEEQSMLVNLSQEIEGNLIKDEELLISDLKELVLASRGIRELSMELLKASQQVKLVGVNSAASFELQDNRYSDTQL